MCHRTLYCPTGVVTAVDDLGRNTSLRCAWPKERNVTVERRGFKGKRLVHDCFGCHIRHSKNRNEAKDLKASPYDCFCGPSGEYASKVGLGTVNKEETRLQIGDIIGIIRGGSVN